MIATCGIPGSDRSTSTRQNAAVGRLRPDRDRPGSSERNEIDDTIEDRALIVASRFRITGDRGPCRGPCRVPDRGHRGGCRRSGPAPSAATAGNCEFRSPSSCRGGILRGIPRGRPPVRIPGASVWFSLRASLAMGVRGITAADMRLRGHHHFEARTGSSIAYTLERRIARRR